MTKASVFTHEEFGAVRTNVVEGTIWYSGMDICHAFGLTSYQDKLRRIPSTDRKIMLFRNCKAGGRMIFITDKGVRFLYKMSISERKDEVMRWLEIDMVVDDIPAADVVTEEVATDMTVAEAVKASDDSKQELPPWKIFDNPEFGRMRVEVIDGQPWFIGNEVASMLGYSNTRQALADHVDDEDKNTVPIRDGIQGNPNKTVINQSGLYSLIFSSKLPSAKRFKHWVTSEVLPSIMNTGAYAMSDAEVIKELSEMKQVIDAIPQMLQTMQQNMMDEILKHMSNTKVESEPSPIQASLEARRFYKIMTAKINAYASVYDVEYTAMFECFIRRMTALGADMKALYLLATKINHGPVEGTAMQIATVPKYRELFLQAENDILADQCLRYIQAIKVAS